MTTDHDNDQLRRILDDLASDIRQIIDKYFSERFNECFDVDEPSPAVPPKVDWTAP